MGGLGHSAAIHSTDEEVIDAYGEAMPVSYTHLVYCKNSKEKISNFMKHINF